MFIKKWLSILKAILAIIPVNIKECLCRIKGCLTNPGECWYRINKALAELRECIGNFRECVANPVTCIRRIFKCLSGYRGCWWLVFLLILLIIILRTCSTPPNHAPANTVPGAQTTNEGTSRAITGLSIADADAGTGSLTVTLAVAHGTLTVTGGSASINNSGTGSVTLTGTVADINLTLAATVTYVPAANYSGTDTLTMTSNDNGHTGTGGPKTDIDTVSINIKVVNNAPVISNGPDSVELTETDAAITSTGTLTVMDVDTTDIVTATRMLSVGGTSDRSDPAAPSDASLLAMLSVTPSMILNGTQTTNTLTLNFDSGTEYFNYLASVETLVLTYTVKATDDGIPPLNDTETVTITITGSNDPPSATILPGASPSCPTILSGNKINAVVSDPEDPPGSLSMLWAPGSTQIIFTSATNPAPTVSLNFPYESSQGVISLTVTDSGGLSVTATKCIKVCNQGSPNCP